MLDPGIDRPNVTNKVAGELLAGLLCCAGRVDELRVRAVAGNRDAGDWYAARRLVDLLAKQGSVHELRRRAHVDERDFLSGVINQYRRGA